MSHPHPELPLPPALPSNGLRVTALGGLGEIGRNMTVFEYQGRLLIVDFAPHDLEFLRQEHAHLRLGFAAERIAGRGVGHDDDLG